MIEQERVRDWFEYMYVAPYRKCSPRTSIEATAVSPSTKREDSTILR